MSSQTNDFVQRTLSDLEAQGSKWWPEHVVSQVAQSSPAELLASTLLEFNRFVDALTLDPQSVWLAQAQSGLSWNLLTKHLAVLTDVGGEPLARLHRERHELFDSSPSFGFEIQTLSGSFYVDLTNFFACRNLGNNKLSIDGAGLVDPPGLPRLNAEVCQILIYGSLAVKPTIATRLSKCDVCAVVGDSDLRIQYQASRYLAVSRIIGGADANASGQVLQSAVENELQARLDMATFHTRRNHTATIAGQNVTSDVYVTGPKGTAAIEVAFQVTTNSTIERKATDAAQRHRLLSAAGILDLYVLDGVGVFQRANAVRKILAASDYCVAYSNAEFDRLAEVIMSRCG